MLAYFKKKQSSRFVKFSIIIGGILILLIAILLIIANIKVYQKRKQLIYRIENLKNKIEEAKNKNSDLEEIISKSNNDQYTERIAREELDLQKPGEKVFSFIKEPSKLNQENENDKKNILLIWLGQINQWFKK